MKLTKQEALKKIEELKLYIADEDNKETKKVVIEIKNRFTGSVKFTSEKTTIKEAVIDNKFNLRGADLPEADLSGANLRGADLSEADLSGANLRGADLSEADLREADLSEADLSGANLHGADLSGANLSGANLRGAKFYGRGGSTKIKKSQINDFLVALGVIIVE